MKRKIFFALAIATVALLALLRIPTPLEVPIRLRRR